MQYVVHSNYRKTRNGRFPSMTLVDRYFKKFEHAIKYALRQKAKGKYVEIGQIVSSRLLTNFLIGQ